MEVALIVFVLTLLAVVALRWRGKQRRLPPLADAGLLATVRALTSAHAPWFLLELARRRPRGSRVFRLRMPLLQHWFVVADADAVRLVFNAHLDKPGVYADFDGAACGVPTMFTMKSSDPRMARRVRALRTHSRRRASSGLCPAGVASWSACCRDSRSCRVARSILRYFLLSSR